MFGIGKLVNELRELNRNIRKIRKSLSDLSFETEFLAEMLRDEVARKEGNFLDADCGEYDRREHLSEEALAELEGIVREDLELESDELIVAITPFDQVYIGSKGDEE